MKDIILRLKYLWSDLKGVVRVWETEKWTEEEPDCIICEGRGYVDTMILDKDFHWVPDGERPCICQIDNDNY